MLELDRYLAEQTMVYLGISPFSEPAAYTQLRIYKNIYDYGETETPMIVIGSSVILPKLLKNRGKKPKNCIIIENEIIIRSIGMLQIHWEEEIFHNFIRCRRHPKSQYRHNTYCW